MCNTQQDTEESIVPVSSGDKPENVRVPARRRTAITARITNCGRAVQNYRDLCDCLLLVMTRRTTHSVKQVTAIMRFLLLAMDFFQRSAVCQLECSESIAQEFSFGRYDSKDILWYLSTFIQSAC